MNQHFERKECFAMASKIKICENSYGRKLWFSLLCDACNYNMDAFVCNVYLVMSERIIMLVKIMNG